jgi:DNA replication and repair protein RecF
MLFSTDLTAKINAQNYSENNLDILAIRSLTLANYRNHQNLDLSFDVKPVIITGDNGVGKTNILEAISLVSPGKGLRNSSLDQLANNKKKAIHWMSRFLIDSTHGKLELSNHYDDKKSPKREIFINDQKIKSHSELSKIFSVIWLTPLMDQIFIGPSQVRRKFIDRMVFNFDDNHATRVNQYDKLMRERIKILKKTTSASENLWLNSIEKNMSEVAIAIAVARVQLIEYLQLMIDLEETSFPKAIISIKGKIEEAVNLKSSLQLESDFEAELKINRKIDLITERTNAGIHRSDLIIYHKDKNIEARSCSTGEQKALLVTIILAQVRARIKWKSSTPVILLDEVIAHLDEKRRFELFEKLLAMKVQFWITGTDNDMFNPLKDKAQFINLK